MAQNGLLSKGITLGYSDSASGSYTTLTNLMSIPDIGASDSDTVEVTVLTDSAHTYIKGLADQGDSIQFVFLYEKTQFLSLSALDGKKFWKVTFPDSLTATFEGQCSVGLVGVGTNEALTYNLNIIPETVVEFA